jgi:2-oxoglutarate ferredoxin oxidoreductase subunit beta
MYGLKRDWELEPLPRAFSINDYEGNVPRWCPGCGDHAVLSSMQRLARDQQIPPEKIVVVSGIGCSSRLPHYMKTYGFHGLHGRPLPVACGVRARRPDLHVFVVTGDGDCCAIGAGHWLHAIRYNMKMVVLMLDNNIYGMTKMQTSPTTPKGQYSNTQPQGSVLSPINPIAVTLAVQNASFVAQTVDWNPPHVYATVRAAHAHGGFAFVRVLQRCPHFMPGNWDTLIQDPDKLLLLDHPDGIALEDDIRKSFKHRTEHDPSDMSTARELAARQDLTPIGLLYRDENAERYDDFTSRGIGMTAAAKREAAQAEVDRFCV